MNTCKKDVLGFPCLREAGHPGLCDPRANDFARYTPQTVVLNSDSLPRIRDMIMTPIVIGPVVFICAIILGQLGLDIYLLVR